MGLFVCYLSVEYIEVVLENIYFSPFGSCGLGEKADAFEFCYELVGGWNGKASDGGHTCCIGCWRLVELVENEECIGGTDSEGLCFGFVVFFDVKDVGEGGDAIFCCLYDSGKEEFDPWKDIVLCSGCHDALVVGVAMTLKIVGEIEYGAFEESLADEVEGDE